MAEPVVSVVVPVYCEASHLAESLSRILAAAVGLGVGVELIVVDDGSGDDTWSLLRAFAERHPEVRSLRLSRNFGKEAAICAGLDAAVGRAVIVMDADLQHPPELIPKLVEAWRSGSAEVVEGVKVGAEGRPSASLGSRLFSRLLRALSGYDLEGASDFKLLDRRVIDEWRRLGESDTFFRGMVAWLGFRRVEVPFEVPPRSSGATRWSLRKRVKLALNAIAAFSSLPLHLVTVLGTLLFVVSFALAVQAFVAKVQGRALEGFTTVIIMLFFVGSGIMLSLGVIGIYVARIYNEVKRRPRYVVAERV